jgi:hypothetical protein
MENTMIPKGRERGSTFYIFAYASHSNFFVPIPGTQENPELRRSNRLRPEIIPGELHEAENWPPHNNLTDLQIPEKLLHPSFS